MLEQGLDGRVPVAGRPTLGGPKDATGHGLSHCRTGTLKFLELLFGGFCKILEATLALQLYFAEANPSIGF